MDKEQQRNLTIYPTWALMSDIAFAQTYFRHISRDDDTLEDLADRLTNYKPESKPPNLPIEHSRILSACAAALHSNNHLLPDKWKTPVPYAMIIATIAQICDELFDDNQRYFYEGNAFPDFYTAHEDIKLPLLHSFVAQGIIILAVTESKHEYDEEIDETNLFNLETCAQATRLLPYSSRQYYVKADRRNNTMMLDRRSGRNILRYAHDAEEPDRPPGFGITKDMQSWEWILACGLAGSRIQVPFSVEEARIIQCIFGLLADEGIGILLEPLFPWTKKEMLPPIVFCATIGFTDFLNNVLGESSDEEILDLANRQVRVTIPRECLS